MVLICVGDVHDALQRMDKPMDKADAKHVDSKLTNKFCTSLTRAYPRFAHISYLMNNNKNFGAVQSRVANKYY